KLLSKITAPTSGEITINGRLSALIEVGSGFHPDLTGRENLYLSGAILGMRRSEITRKLDSIVDFAGVREFIDTPVKRYSSGMYVRLGFSIAAHLHPHILLLDEVLAVGDASFQMKCYDRINELKKTGTTIVFISHDLNAVEFLCDRALLLGCGEIVGDGPPSEVIRHYRATANYRESSRENTRTDEAKSIRITGLRLQACDGRDVATASTGSPLLAVVEFEATEFLDDVIFEIFYYAQDGSLQCQFSTFAEQIEIDRGSGAVHFSCDELGLRPGIYSAEATIRRRTDGEEIDWLPRSAILRVDLGVTIRGRFHVPHSWQIKQYRHSIPSAQSLYEITSGFHAARNDSE
ncbi:MAG: ABC transporter ATP-binding protein, partial [Blastocatellia bacterium]